MIQWQGEQSGATCICLSRVGLTPPRSPSLPKPTAAVKTPFVNGGSPAWKSLSLGRRDSPLCRRCDHRSHRYCKRPSKSTVVVKSVQEAQFSTVTPGIACRSASFQTKAWRVTVVQVALIACMVLLLPSQLYTKVWAAAAGSSNHVLHSSQPRAVVEKVKRLTSATDQRAIASTLWHGHPDLVYCTMLRFRCVRLICYCSGLEMMRAA